MDLSGGVTLSSFVLGMAWMKTRILALTLKTSFAHHHEQQHNRILRLKSPAQRARRKFLMCRSTDLTIRDAAPRYGDERQSGIVEARYLYDFQGLDPSQCGFYLSPPSSGFFYVFRPLEATFRDKRTIVLLVVKISFEWCLVISIWFTNVAASFLLQDC